VDRFAFVGGAGRDTYDVQALALGENTIALLMRRRKPVGALAGILAVYALVDLDTVTILPVSLALLTVAELRERRTVAVAAAVVVAMPFVHGDAVNLAANTLPHVLAVGLAVGVGSWLRARGQSRVRAQADPVG
jgi:Sec-independent protein secretion pathway component TatC